MISKEDVRAAAIEIFNEIHGPLRQTSPYKIEPDTLDSVWEFLKHEIRTPAGSKEVGALDGSRHDLAKASPEVQSQCKGFETNEQEHRAIVVQVWLTRNICNLADFFARCLRTGRSTNTTESDREVIEQIFARAHDLSQGRGAFSTWCHEMEMDIVRHEDGYLERHGHEHLERRPRYDKFTWRHFTQASEEYAMAKNARSVMTVESVGSTESKSLSSYTDAELLEELLARSRLPGSSLSARSLSNVVDTMGSTLMW